MAGKKPSSRRAPIPSPLIPPPDPYLIERLESVCKIEPDRFLTPSPELSQLLRETSKSIYSHLRPRCSPDVDAPYELLVDPIFDTSQIWGQIENVLEDIVPSLKRNLNKKMKKISQQQQQQLPNKSDFGGKGKQPIEEAIRVDEEKDDDEDEEEREEDEDEKDDDEDDEDEEVEDKNEHKYEFEDKFLNIKDLEDFLERGDAEYWDVNSNKIKKNKKRNMIDNDEDEDDEIDVGGGFKLEDVDDDSDLPDDYAENAWYEDFFESKNKKKGKNIVSEKKGKNIVSEKKGKRYLARSSLDGSEYLKMENKQEEDESDDTQGMEFLSTHEKELRNMQSKTKQMEKENLEPKIWYMQGEITAAKRPKNSALEVDLDFQHARRPPPVITEEDNSSLEAMIKKRIIEGRFDNVQRAPSLISKAPKERKELDENKSEKGLSEIYEDEYARKTALIAVPFSNCEEKKREVNTSFERTFFMLDAHAHFLFAPKPVIEDMCVRSIVPALAMEEVAPLAVSDAAMLAPEEVFEGKAYTKSEVELTQIDRRRRRANKKRRFKAAENARRFANITRDDTRHKESLNGSEVW